MKILDNILKMHYDPIGATGDVLSELFGGDDKKGGSTDANASSNTNSSIDAATRSDKPLSQKTTDEVYAEAYRSLGIEVNPSASTTGSAGITGTGVSNNYAQSEIMAAIIAAYVSAPKAEEAAGQGPFSPARPEA